MSEHITFPFDIDNERLPTPRKDSVEASAHAVQISLFCVGFGPQRGLA
jgi:hypothetical protein